MEVVGDGVLVTSLKSLVIWAAVWEILFLIMLLSMLLFELARVTRYFAASIVHRPFVSIFFGNPRINSQKHRHMLRSIFCSCVVETKIFATIMDSFSPDSAQCALGCPFGLKKTYRRRMISNQLQCR